MKCSKCGAELEDSVLFCRECGNKIVDIEQERKFCRECGQELNAETKFCPNCGANTIYIQKESAGEKDTQDIWIKVETISQTEKEGDESNVTGIRGLQKIFKQKEDFGKIIKEKILLYWKNMDLFCKITLFFTLIIVILLMIALCKGKVSAIILSILQISGVIAVLLMHKNVIKIEKEWMKYCTLTVAIVLTLFHLNFYIGKEQQRIEIDHSQIRQPVEKEVSTTAVIPYDAADCVGKDVKMIRNAFYSAGFRNIKEERIEDLKSADADRVGNIETISVGGDSAFVKGKEIDKIDEVKIQYHVFEKYKVTMQVDFIPNFIFSKYDVELYLDNELQETLAHGEDKDFEFITEPGDHTFTFQEKGYSSVKGSMVLHVTGDVTVSLQISCYSDKVDVETIFIEDMGAVGENEVMIPASCLNYNNVHAEDYAEQLEAAGFKNVKLEAIYDIVSDDVNIGKIEQVKIGEETEFKRGDIFANNIAVVISYHAKEADDPVKQAQEAAKAELEEQFPVEMARRAVVVAMTNRQAEDVWESGECDLQKLHAYSDIETSFLMIDMDGIWTAIDENTWKVEGIILREYKDIDSYFKITCDIRMGDENYVVANLDYWKGTEDEVYGDAVQKKETEHLDLSNDNIYLTVSGDLINENRDEMAAYHKIVEKEKRQEWIAGQFGWGGKHIALTELIKKNLNDSKSFKHVNTEYLDVSDEEVQTIVNQMLQETGISERVEIGDLFIMEEFTAKNAFNATVKNTAYAIAHEEDDSIVLLGIE